jgi:cell division protein FtsB
MAPRLPPEVALGGWLHRHACFVAKNAMRAERRRQSREQQAAEMNALPDHSDAVLTQLKPLLDEAIDHLGQRDRRAVMLRFFEQRDLRAVGELMGISENTARMRVTRAVEKLRVILQHRGVTLSAAGLISVLAAHAVSAAPSGMAATVAGASLAGAAGGGAGISLTILKLIAMTKIKTAVLGALVVAGVTTSILVQHQAQARLRESGQILSQESERLDQLRAENARLTKLADTANSGNQAADLARLRVEAEALRLQTNDLARLREQQLQAKARPDASPPGMTPEQARDYGMARMDFAKSAVMALLMYAQDNQHMYPTSFDQVTNYFPGASRNQTNVSSDEFEITYQGTFDGIKNPSQTIVVRQTDAWQGPNGNWLKAYGFADGHSELHSEKGNDFQAFESQHLSPPPETGQAGGP